MIEVDLHEAIGHGIANGAAAAAVGLALLLPRWVFIGMRSDLRRWRDRTTAKREAKQAAKKVDRKEPAVRANQIDPVSNANEDIARSEH